MIDAQLARRARSAAAVVDVEEASARLRRLRRAAPRRAAAARRPRRRAPPPRTSRAVDAEALGPALEVRRRERADARARPRAAPPPRTARSSPCPSSRRRAARQPALRARRCALEQRADRREREARAPQRRALALEIDQALEPGRGRPARASRIGAQAPRLIAPCSASTGGIPSTASLVEPDRREEELHRVSALGADLVTELEAVDLARRADHLAVLVATAARTALTGDTILFGYSLRGFSSSGVLDDVPDDRDSPSRPSSACGCCCRCVSTSGTSC